MASLVYASSRQSEDPPIWYPPTTSETAAGTAMTSQPPRRRRISAPGARSAAGTAAASPGSAANVVGGSGDPMSVSATLSFPGARSRPDGALPPGYPAGKRAPAAVNVLLTSAPPRRSQPNPPSQALRRSLYGHEGRKNHSHPSITTRAGSILHGCPSHVAGAA